MLMTIDPDPPDLIRVASCTLENRKKALRFIAALRKTVDIVFPLPEKEPAQ
jgi:hypothetical protein